MSLVDSIFKYSPAGLLSSGHLGHHTPHRKSTPMPTWAVVMIVGGFSIIFGSIAIVTVIDSIRNKKKKSQENN